MKFQDRIKRFVIALFGIKPIDVGYPFVPSGADDDAFLRNLEQTREHFTSLDGTCTFCGETCGKCHCW